MAAAELFRITIGYVAKLLTDEDIDPNFRANIAKALKECPKVRTLLDAEGPPTKELKAAFARAAEKPEEKVKDPEVAKLVKKLANVEVEELVDMLADVDVDVDEDVDSKVHEAAAIILRTKGNINDALEPEISSLVYGVDDGNYCAAKAMIRLLELWDDSEKINLGYDDTLTVIRRVKEGTAEPGACSEAFGLLISILCDLRECDFTHVRTGAGG